MSKFKRYRQQSVGLPEVYHKGHGGFEPLGSWVVTNQWELSKQDGDNSGAQSLHEIKTGQS